MEWTGQYLVPKLTIYCWITLTGQYKGPGAPELHPKLLYLHCAVLMNHDQWIILWKQLERSALVATASRASAAFVSTWKTPGATRGGSEGCEAIREQPANHRSLVNSSMLAVMHLTRHSLHQISSVAFQHPEYVMSNIVKSYSSPHRRPACSNNIRTLRGAPWCYW